MTPRLLPESSYAFRRELLSLFDRYTPADRFWYLSDDVCIVVCPICDGAVTVRFAGMAPRADLHCEFGCAESEIVDALKGSAAA